MIKASLVGLVSALSAQSVASAAIPTTVSATTSLHSTAVLKQSPSGTKWLSFPTANTHHHELRQKFSVTRSAPVATTTASLDFFTVHRDALELHPACEMVLVSERTNPSSTLVHRSYEQRVGGVRVYGGEFKMTLSATGEQLEVLSTHGEPLTEKALDASFNNMDVVTALQTTPTDRDIRRGIQAHISSSRVNSDSIEEEVETSATELVWYQSQPSSRATLAYFVKGSVATQDQFILFYAFLQASSGEVLSLVQLNDDEHLNDVTAALGSNGNQGVSATSVGTSAVDVTVSSLPPSPFASPISDAMIYCYDQYAKDFNDDQDDNYYDPDPDRFSNNTLVFDTTSGDHVYPTADAELNLLVDNTLYSKYMYYSLSAGEYQTWMKVDGRLNIEYNLSLANAYFDGSWGIHFGTGFITDDVVAHEWSHGYTQTGDNLVYQRQSGSMNEGFSDVFGESIDILNEDSADTDVLRASSGQCTSTMNPRYGYGPSPGTDNGNRWSIGEEVSYYHWSNGDGSFRDMYKPECFFHPGATYSAYYACTTYYDNGGVHLNSGVFNRLFAVLVDGGQYDQGDSVVVIAGLGISKTLNLYWKTHQELTAHAQFYDFAMAIKQVCSVNIGEPLYYPNVFNSTISEIDSLTSSDCELVSEAVAASGMDSTADVCPNIDCSGAKCEWAQCPAAEDGNYEVFHEDYDYYMGDSRVSGTSGRIEPACANSSASTYVRVFNQNYFHLNEFTLSCIQFGYIMLGKTTVSIDVYIDDNGGKPDLDSMVLIASKDVTTVNANYHMQVQTLSFDSPVTLPFNHSSQTLVVVMTTPVMAEGFIGGGGQVNEDVNVYGVPTGQTFVGGVCMPDLIASNSSIQWYVRLQGTSTYLPGGSASDGFDDNEVIAAIVAGCVIGAALIGFSYYVMTKNSDKLSKHHVMLEDHDESKL